MRFVFPSLVCLAFASLLPAADESIAIRAAIQQYVDIREHPDPKSLQNLFTEDADQLVSSGEWRKGRDNVVTGAIASSQREAGRRTITVETVRMLAETVAIADGRYVLTDAAGKPVRNMWTSIVLVRDGSGWHISAIRNMLPAPPAK